jgi:hypothetical protein
VVTFSAPGGLDAASGDDVGYVPVHRVFGPDADLASEAFVVFDEHVRGLLEELECLG